MSDQRRGYVRRADRDLLNRPSKLRRMRSQWWAVRMKGLGLPALETEDCGDGVVKRGKKSVHCFLTRKV